MIGRYVTLTKAICYNLWLGKESGYGASFYGEGAWGYIGK